MKSIVMESKTNLRGQYIHCFDFVITALRSVIVQVPPPENEETVESDSNHNQNKQPAAAAKSIRVSFKRCWCFSGVMLT